MSYRCNYVFFFFQAEDGIRDIGVTGVQTCALPISQWKPVAEALRYRAMMKKPTSISPIRPMYFQGYMLPSGICVPSPCPKTSPIWGIRSASAGIMLSTVNRAVKPRAPTASLRNVSIGFTAKRSLCTKYAVEAMLRTAIQRTSRLKTRSEEHTSELQSRQYLVCRLL